MTLSLIILVGAPAVYSMIQAPAQIEAQKEILAAISIGRSPASVDVSSAEKLAAYKSNFEPKNSIKSKSVTMDFKCKTKDKNPTEETDGKLIRLKSDACLNDKWKDVSIVNKTNGFTAAVIFVNQGFTTDFIDLDEGDNKLVVSGINERGQAVEQRLTIKRRAPASL